MSEGQGPGAPDLARLTRELAETRELAVLGVECSITALSALQTTLEAIDLLRTGQGLVASERIDRTLRLVREKYARLGAFIESEDIGR